MDRWATYELNLGEVDFKRNKKLFVDEGFNQKWIFYLSLISFWKFEFENLICFYKDEVDLFLREMRYKFNRWKIVHWKLLQVFQHHHRKCLCSTHIYRSRSHMFISQLTKSNQRQFPSRWIVPYQISLQPPLHHRWMHNL